VLQTMLLPLLPLLLERTLTKCLVAIMMIFTSIEALHRKAYLCW
jgi:hypothetical protein